MLLTKNIIEAKLIIMGDKFTNYTVHSASFKKFSPANLMGKKAKRINQAE